MKGIDVSTFNGEIIKGFCWQFTDRLGIGNKFFDGNFLYK